MKKRVILTAAILIIVVVMGVFVGYRKKSPEEIIDKAIGNINKYECVSMNVTGGIITDFSYNDTDMTAGTSFDIDVETNISNKTGMYINGTTKYDILGVSSEVPFETYIEQDNDKMYEYTYNVDTESWDYEQVENQEVSIKNELFAQLKDILKNKGTYELREKSERVNNVNCYVIDYKISANDFFEIITLANEIKGNEDINNENQSTLNSLFNKASTIDETIDIVIYISKIRYLPVKCILNINDFMNASINAMAEGEESLGMYQNANVNLELEINFKNFSKSKIVVIPEEVKEMATEKENDNFEF